VERSVAAWRVEWCGQSALDNDDAIHLAPQPDRLPKLHACVSAQPYSHRLDASVSLFCLGPLPFGSWMGEANQANNGAMHERGLRLPEPAVVRRPRRPIGESPAFCRCLHLPLGTALPLHQFIEQHSTQPRDDEGLS
jgi:hypothetical protein